MENAHLRFGLLEYVRFTEKASSVVTPHSLSSTEKSAGVMIDVLAPRARKTSASIRMKSRLS